LRIADAKVALDRRHEKAQHLPIDEARDVRQREHADDVPRITRLGGDSRARGHRRKLPLAGIKARESSRSRRAATHHNGTADYPTADDPPVASSMKKLPGCGIGGAKIALSRPRVAATARRCRPPAIA